MLMIEALEAGVPIVCFPSAGAIELLGKEYIYMTKHFSIDELADMVLRADKSDLEFLREREKILRYHSTNTKLRVVCEVYNRIISQKLGIEKIREG